MNRIFFIGAMDRIAARPEDSTLDLLDRTGKNTGNMLIGHSVMRHLQPEASSRNMRLPPEQIRAEFDRVVIPASNFVYGGYDLSCLADFVERVDLPCVMIGVGAQAPTYSSEIKLKEGTTRFLRAVAERSVTIGARGYFTAEWLGKYGIKNVDVIGCPSFFWTCSGELHVDKKPFGELRRIALNGSRNVIAHSMDPSQMQSVERQLFEQVRRYDAGFFAQNEHHEAILARNKDDEQNDALLDPILKYYGATANDRDVVDFFRECCHIYFSIEEWSEAIRSYDFAIGTRFHGNMIALQNGVPAVIIAHDARTQELCELLHIPFLTVGNLRTVSLRWIYELADYAATSLAFSALFSAYIAFLERNNLQHMLEPSRQIPRGGEMLAYRKMQDWFSSLPSFQSPR